MLGSQQLLREGILMFNAPRCLLFARGHSLPSIPSALPTRTPPGLLVQSLISLFTLLVMTSPSSALAQSFRSLGGELDPLLGSTRSSALGISADGRYITGSFQQRMMRWSEEDGIEMLGPFAPFRLNPRGTGIKVSGDGSVVVGRELSSEVRPRYWDEASGQVTSLLPDGTAVPGSINLAVSDDGRTLGGLADRGMRTSAWIYSEERGFEYLNIPGTTRFSAGRINGLSPDGEYAVGYVGALWSDEPPEVQEWGGTAPIRWSAAAGFDRLRLPSEFSRGRGQELSADGNIVVGYLTRFNESETQGAIWNVEEDTVIVLSDLDSTDGVISRALDVSADGEIVVGVAQEGAFIWDAANGMRLVADVLSTTFGLDLTGWTLVDAVGISADGRILTGNGINPLGEAEAWVAVIPEPSTALLMGLGLLFLARSSRAGDS